MNNRPRSRDRAMNIIFANNNYHIKGGADKVFFDEIELMASRGHVTIPFGMNGSRNLPSPYTKFFPADTHVDDIGLKEKIRTVTKIFYNFEARRRFSDLLGTVSVDLIHAHNIYGRLTSAIIDAAERKDVPVVLTAHDYKSVCPSYLMLNHGQICERCKNGRYFHCVLTKCHRNSYLDSAIYTTESYFNKLFRKYAGVRFILCPSEFLKRKLILMGVQENKLVVIRNFLDYTAYRPKYGTTNYILYAGKLTHEKGVLTLIRAIEGLDIEVRIVGDGPLRRAYEEYVKKNKISNVIFEGFQTGEALQTLFRNAAFHVVPSACYENAPMTILEAFAYGKPVIGSRLGGIEEMVDDGIVGLLFEPGSSEELREKIRYMLDNPATAERMGRKAREKLEQVYSPESHYRNLVDVYARVVRQ